jgi:hypothetical protein
MLWKSPQAMGSWHPLQCTKQLSLEATVFKAGHALAANMQHLSLHHMLLPSAACQLLLLPQVLGPPAQHC